MYDIVLFQAIDFRTWFCHVLEDNAIVTMNQLRKETVGITCLLTYFTHCMYVH